MTTNLLILMIMLGISVVGLIVAAFRKNQDVLFLSFFLFVASSFSIGILLTQ